MESIGEPRDNSLRVVITESAADGTAEQMQIGDLNLRGRPIVPIPHKRPLELFWESYIAYAVRNESYSVPEEGQLPPDNMLNQRTESAFLVFITNATLASNDYPGPFRHWELICLNHIVDVVSMVSPTVREL